MNDSEKIKCMVIDDEDAAIEVLRHFITQIPYLEYAGGYTEPIAGLQAAQIQDVDILFVDVQMPEISGLDLIKNVSSRCCIILTTAYSQYALEGFDLDVTDYLLKPVPFSRFLKAVEKARNQLALQVKELPTQESTDDFILVKGDAKGKFIKVDYKDIEYVEGMKNYVAIVFGAKKVLSLLNIRDIENKLPFPQFIRVHKSYIVSIAKISFIEGNQIILKNLPGEKIPIGDTYKRLFMDAMKKAMIR